MFNFFTSMPFQPPEVRRSKENALPMKQQVGFELGTFLVPKVECFSRLATVCSECQISACDKYDFSSCENRAAYGSN